jgi:hypothetical protein
LMFRAVQCCLQYALCCSTHTHTHTLFLLIFPMMKAVLMLKGSSVARRLQLKACGLQTLDCAGLWLGIGL